MRDCLISEYEKIDIDKDGYIDRNDCKQTLINIFKREMF